ncbi:MAG: hypothetical protein HOP02_07165 [Methylococcaceae bacterium]|nr:hypothetical protein [Methylococcaceae bacterium]
MISCIKKNFFKLVLASLLSIILGLNYFGFCYNQSRFLSDEEKIKIVVQEILVRYPKLGDVHEQLSTHNGIRQWKTVKTWPENPIPYHDIAEFFTINPNCCQVTTNYKTIGGEGDTVGCWNRLTGHKSSVVGIRYLLRYQNNEGIIQTKLLEIFPSISNCGELVWELG